MYNSHPAFRRRRWCSTGHPTDRSHHPVHGRWRFLAISTLDDRGSNIITFWHRQPTHAIRTDGQRFRVRCRCGSTGQTNWGRWTEVNESIRYAWFGIVAILLVLLGAASYVQVIGADDLRPHEA